MTNAQQQLQLERVSQNIGELVVAFCRGRVGRDFHLSELADYISKRATTSPDSASRILRDLRTKGAVRYSVVSRRLSLYHVDAVREAA